MEERIGSNWRPCQRILANCVMWTASPGCVALPARPSAPASSSESLPQNKNGYGLGLEDVDENDQPVPGTFRDIAVFDPSSISVCLPLGSGNKPVTEEWELVNVSGEAHNFHIHQAKFYVLPQNAPQGDAGKLMDSVALPNGGAEAAMVRWRVGEVGAARSQASRSEFPFSEPGDFIYHCHIGEHQDSGMMARIRVIPFH